MPYPSVCPKLFWTIQIVLDGYQLFWSCPSRFGRVQIILVRFKLDFSGLFWPVQNDWYLTKMIWSVQNHFGPIEGQGIRSITFLVLYPLQSQSSTIMNIVSHLRDQWTNQKLCGLVRIVIRMYCSVYTWVYYIKNANVFMNFLTIFLSTKSMDRTFALLFFRWNVLGLRLST